MSPDDQASDAPSFLPTILDRPAVLLGLALVIVVVSLAPYVWLGEGAHLLVHDYLDGINRFGPFERGLLLNPSPQTDQLLISWLGLFWGHVANATLLRVVGGVGFYFLLRRYTRSMMPAFVALLVAAAFAVVPHYPPGNLSVLGLPLVVLLLDNLDRRLAVPASAVGLALCAYHTDFFLSGIFMVGVAGLWVLWRWRRAGFPAAVVFGLVCFMLGSALAHVSMVAELFAAASGQTHRAEMQLHRMSGTDAWGALRNAGRLFVASQYHAESRHGLVILPSMVALAALLAGRGKLRVGRQLSLLFAAALFCSALYGAYAWSPVLEFYDSTGLGFNYSRFFFLLPPAWYFVWALVLANLWSEFRPQRIAAFAVIALATLQLGLNLSHSNSQAFSKEPSFAQFFSDHLFNDVRAEITLEPGERVGCIGFHPAVARYHGLATLGFYRTLYPLEDKHQIQKIIAAELAASDELNSYFSYWGSRAYLFDDAIGRNLHDQTAQRARLQTIESRLNVEALREARVPYLLSTVPISNAAALGLKEVLRRDEPKDWYRMVVYAVP